jgi:chromosome condensin MukBEF ATPase and DNA-binding subunit MukB
LLIKYHFICIHLDSRGKKRTVEDDFELHQNKKSCNSSHESVETKMANLEKKCADLEAKLKVYEEDYIRKFFIKAFTNVYITS